VLKYRLSKLTYPWSIHKIPLLSSRTITETKFGIPCFLIESKGMILFDEVTLSFSPKESLVEFRINWSSSSASIIILCSAKTMSMNPARTTKWVQNQSQKIIQVMFLLTSYIALCLFGFGSDSGNNRIIQTNYVVDSLKLIFTQSRAWFFHVLGYVVICLRSTYRWISDYFSKLLHPWCFLKQI